MTSTTCHPLQSVLLLLVLLASPGCLCCTVLQLMYCTNPPTVRPGAVSCGPGVCRGPAFVSHGNLSRYAHVITLVPLLCRNYNAAHKTKQYLLFRQRAGREKFKIDLHTAQAQRDAGRCMTALQASAAAMAYLQILHQNMGEVCFSASWLAAQLAALPRPYSSTGSPDAIRKCWHNMWSRASMH